MKQISKTEIVELETSGNTNLHVILAVNTKNQSYLYLILAMRLHTIEKWLDMSALCEDTICSYDRKMIALLLAQWQCLCPQLPSSRAFEGQPTTPLSSSSTSSSSSWEEMKTAFFLILFIIYKTSHVVCMYLCVYVCQCARQVSYTSVTMFVSIYGDIYVFCLVCCVCKL